MDYTTVPRSLIYRDRRSLKEFGAYETESITRPLADALLQIDIIQYSDSERRALWFMNAAFHICTMIMLEEDPRWRISEYKIVAIPSNWSNASISECQVLTLSIVLLLLNHLETPLKDFHPLGESVRNTISDILYNEDNMFYYARLQGKLEDDSFVPNTIPNSTFSPRYIDKETVHDVMSEEDFNWVRFTNYLEERSVRDIVEAFGKTEDEKHNVVDMLRQASHSYYLASYNDCPEKVDKMLKKIDKEIFLKFNPNEEREITEEDKAELIIPIDPEPYEARIKELEMEVESLTSENKELKKQQPTERPAEDDIESLKQQISELKMEIADMEKREGLDAPKAALLVRIACTKLGGMPNNRENAWPLISNLWGTAEASARKRLRERVKEETVEDLASLFDSVSPKIAGIIREEGKVIIEKQKKVK